MSFDQAWCSFPFPSLSSSALTLVPKPEWSVRFLEHSDDVSIQPHSLLFTHDQDACVLHGKFVTKDKYVDYHDRVFKREFGSQIFRSFSGIQAHCFDTYMLTYLAFAFTMGFLSAIQIQKLIPSPELFKTFVQDCMTSFGRGFGSSLFQTSNEKDEVINVMKEFSKLIEVAALTACFSNLAPLCSTLIQWASLLGLVLIPQFGQEMMVKFLALFTTPKAHGYNEKVEPFMTVFFTLISVLFTGSLSSGAVNNFFRVADLTGCKDVIKDGSKSLITYLTDMSMDFLRSLVALRSEEAVKNIFSNIDIAKEQKDIVRSIPALLLDMNQAILICGQMSADPTLYASLSSYQDLLTQADSVQKTLARIPKYPFAERIHFSRVYAKLYESVMGAVNTRNSMARVEPTVLYLSGPAGIMKTSIAEQISDKIAQRLWPKEFAENSHRYDRNPLQKHWDRYCNQPICKMEEAFSAPRQGKDTTNEEHQSWLSLVSSSVYPVPMASINDKKTVFTSEVVICTSNIAFPETQSVDRAALLRRFQNHTLCCWKPGFPKYDNTGLLDSPYTQTGACKDLSHLQIYAFDPKRQLLVPSSAVKQQFVNNIAPSTTLEFDQWTLTSIDDKMFRDHYTPVSVDDLVDRIVDGVKFRRNLANDRAKAHGDDKSLIYVSEDTFFVQPNDTTFPKRLDFCYENASLDTFTRIDTLDELFNFPLQALKKMADRSQSKATQQVFQRWHDKQVPQSFSMGAAASQQIMECALRIITAYRVFELTKYPWDFGSDQSAILRLREKFITIVDGKLHILMQRPDGTQFYMDHDINKLNEIDFILPPGSYDDIKQIADSHDIKLWSKWMCYAYRFAVVLFTFFIFFVCYVAAFTIIVSIFSSIIGLFFPPRKIAPYSEDDFNKFREQYSKAGRDYPEWLQEWNPENNGIIPYEYYESGVFAMSLDELELMLKGIRDMDFDRHEDDDGNMVYSKNGVKYRWNRESTKWEEYDKSSKRGSTKYARRNRVRGNAKAHASSWIEEMSVDDNSPNSKLLDLFASQCIRITYSSPTGRSLTMYGIKIVGQTVLVPRHLLGTDDCAYYKFKVETDTISFTEVVSKVNIKSFVSAKDISGFDLSKTDGLLISFKLLPVTKSLMGHVANNLITCSWYKGVDAVALIPRIERGESGCGKVTLAVPCGAVNMMGPVSYRDGAYAEYTCCLYKTQIPDLISGDCGSILLVKEDGQLRIAGIYVAGDEHQHVSYFQPITRGLIESLTENVKVHGFEEFPPVDPCEPLSKYINNPLPALGRYLNADAPGVSCIPPSEIRPSKLQLENKRLFDHDILSAPAVLNREAMQKAVIKKWHEPGFFDTPFLERAVEWVKQDLSNFNKCTPLTLQESINGETHFGQSSKLAMDTSPGLPWSFLKDPGSIGKASYFDFVDGQHVPKPIVVESVEHVISSRKSGLLQPGLFRGTLKDERRDIERVLDSKTRIFTAGSMEKVIADRMLFLDFVYQFKEGRIQMQHAYGINPESLEWNEMITKHIQIGSHHFGFDYSGFDASESLQLLQCVSECVSSVYPEEYHKEIEASGIESFNHFVVIDGDLYQYHQGNPSGCTMTTIYNTIANWILLYYSWIKLAIDYGHPCDRAHYLQNCIVHAYGDDFICTVSKDALWFNGETIPPILDVCGIKATAPDKTACARFYPLSELTFLTRSFIPNTFPGSKSIYVAPLPKTLLEDIPMWVYKGSCEEDFTSTIRTCIRSSSFWGRSYFSYYIAKLRTTEIGKRILQKIDVDQIFRDASQPFVSGHEVVVDFERICFNIKSGEDAFLSNMFLTPVYYKTLKFPCVENAYQFAKEMFHKSEGRSPTDYLTMRPFHAKERGSLI